LTKIAKLAIIILGVVKIKVNSTDMQNNFGKYLRLSAKEPIIITKNGKEVAKLVNSDFEDRTYILKESKSTYDCEGAKITFEEFLKITDNSEERFEYIDGEIYLLSSPKVTHQKILVELTVLFYDFLNGDNCRTAIAPFDIKLKNSKNEINIVQPDLMIICDMDEKTDNQDYYTGVPKLIVEIISESTRKKDYINKLNLYLNSGVKEYWIVNPLSKEITLFCFEENEIVDNKTFRIGEKVNSFIFGDLIVDTDAIFVHR